MGNAQPRYGGSGAVSERGSEGVSGARLRLSGGVDYSLFSALLAQHFQHMVSE
jgi:hypothetical protein